MSDLQTLIEAQGEAITAFRDDVLSRLDAERKEREELELRVNRMGLTGALAGERRELKAVGEALRSYIRSGDVGALSRLVEAKGMSVGSDFEGGYTVLPAFSAELTRRVFEVSPLRQYARVVTVSTSAFEEIADTDEPDASWVGETSPRPDTAAPDIGKLTIPVNEIYAMPKVTQTLLDDSAIDIGNWLVEKVALRFSRLEGAAFVAGDGVAKPRGFLSYPTASTGDNSRAWGTMQYVPTGAASDFATEDPADALIDLQTALKAEYRTRAVWVMNRATAGKIRKFKDDQDRYLWSESLQAGQPPLLLGHPVVLAEDMPDVGSNAFPVAFGDFAAGYTIVDRHGDRLLRDPYTDKPNVRFYVYRRVGGAANNTEAIKLLKCSSS